MIKDKISGKELGRAHEKYDDMIDFVRKNLPQERSSIVHGDYKFDNMVRGSSSWFFELEVDIADSTPGRSQCACGARLGTINSGESTNGYRLPTVSILVPAQCRLSTSKPERITNAE